MAQYRIGTIAHLVVFMALVYLAGCVAGVLRYR